MPADDLVAVLRVQLDDPALLRGERAVLAQDPGRDAELADVVQDAGEAQGLHPVLLHAQFTGDQLGGAAHPLAVPAGVAVLDVDGLDERPDGGAVGGVLAVVLREDPAGDVHRAAGRPARTAARTELCQRTAIISPASACTRCGPSASGPSSPRQACRTATRSAVTRIPPSSAASTRLKTSAVAQGGSRAYGRSGTAPPRHRRAWRARRGRRTSMRRPRRSARAGRRARHGARRRAAGPPGPRARRERRRGRRRTAAAGRPRRAEGGRTIRRRSARSCRGRASGRGVRRPRGARRAGERPHGRRGPGDSAGSGAEHGAGQRAHRMWTRAAPVCPSPVPPPSSLVRWRRQASELGHSRQAPEAAPELAHIE